MSNLTTFQEVKDYVSEALDSFVRDPADSDFQRGYEEALKELRREMGFEPDEDPNNIWRDAETPFAENH